MPRWLILAGAYYLLVACVIRWVPRFRDRWDTIRGTLGPEGAGIAGCVILSILSLSSFLLGWPLDLIGKVGQESKRLRMIETWILAVTVLNLLLLFLPIERWHWLLLFPALTIADSAYALVYFLITWTEVKFPARSVLLDVVRYFQIIFAFAALFLASHHLSGATAFCSGNKPVLNLSPTQALYLSATTAMTVGPGNMAPCLAGSTRLVFFLQPAALIPLEVFCIVLILAIEIPRITSNQIVKGPKGGGEIGPSIPTQSRS